VRRLRRRGSLDAVTGYDPAFLAPAGARGPDAVDLHVPLPAPRDGRPLRVLEHPRFTVLLDPARRLALAAAVAVDGARLRPLPRTGGWRPDPLAPEEEQAGAALYHRNALDRGQLVRRRDPMWGTEAEAVAAGEETFVYTNAVPQVGRLNAAKELWGRLEDHVLTYAQATDRRMVVHTGPVLAPDDPVYRGVGLPRRFWKVAAWAAGRWRVPDGGGPIGRTLHLQAAAFVLDQAPPLPEGGPPGAGGAAVPPTDAGELPPLGPYRAFQVPVADVAALAGLDLGPLPAADVLGAAEAGRTVAPAALPTPGGPPVPGWVELRGPGDVHVAGGP
jgi:endonuclease G